MRTRRAIWHRSLNVLQSQNTQNSSDYSCVFAQSERPNFNAISHAWLASWGKRGILTAIGNKNNFTELTTMSLLSMLFTCLTLVIIAIHLFTHWRLNRFGQQLLEDKHQSSQDILKQLLTMQHELSEKIHKNLLSGMQHLQESLATGMNQTRQQVNESLKLQNDNLGKQMKQLTEEVHTRLQQISQQVDKRLAEGFEKTNATFNDVLKRLALIDSAQKKISELSTNVVSLQSILNDKRSRGAFGEVQLTSLIRNILPESNIAFQHTLSNGKRVDCILFLPEPTGNISIDAKFPLETYQKLINPDLSAIEIKQAEQQFRVDIRKHILDIADKYIIPNETADGAMMFIPAEAIFAEIHSHFPECVELANKHHVWMVSPTTMMAILTTARAVLKDDATRKQVHIIQEHLMHLAKDFGRFQKRMDNLSRHIGQAKEDVDDVNKSAKKLTNRFIKIEKCEVEPLLEEKDVEVE